ALIGDHPDREVRCQLWLAPRLPEADAGLVEVELRHAAAEIGVQESEIGVVGVRQNSSVGRSVLQEWYDDFLKRSLGAYRRRQDTQGKTDNRDSGQAHLILEDLVRAGDDRLPPPRLRRGVSLILPLHARRVAHVLQREC